MPVRSRIEILGIPMPTTSKVIPPQANIFTVIEEDDQYAELHREEYPVFQVIIPNHDQIELTRSGFVQRRTGEEINSTRLWLSRRRRVGEGHVVKRRLYWKDR